MTTRSPVRVLAIAMLVVAAGVVRSRGAAPEVEFEIAKIYWEYNASANDLGVHVSLDAEDWRRLKIVRPDRHTIFNVEGKGPYRDLGMTELFFEGAEPSLADMPLAELLALFPEGSYEFDGRTVDGADLSSTATFSHAIPAGPVPTAVLGPGNSLVISWTAVTSPPPGFPNEPINVVKYQVLVGKGDPYQVIVPSTTLSVTVSPELVAALPAGPNPFEVLAIDASGNQTLTEGTFSKP